MKLELAQRVALYRLFRRMSQYQLADAAGITRNMIYLIESGKKWDMKMATIEKIADALGVPPLRLLYSKNELREALRDDAKRGDRYIEEAEGWDEEGGEETP